MKNIKQLKSVGIICAACAFILGSVFVFVPVKQVDAASTTVLAKSSNKSSTKKSKPAKKPSTSKKESKAPAGGKKSNNKYAQKSLSGDCKKVAGKCVVFSKSGCGNFYIKGRHYGGSQACKILKKNCNNSTGNNNNNSQITVTRTIDLNNNATSSVNNMATSSLLRRECTPGVDCPDGDLGPIIRQTLVTPAFASRNSKTCPLFWVSGEQTKDSTIKCTLVYPDGTRNDVPTDPMANGYDSGYPLPIGKSILVCLRSTTYQEEVLGNQNGQEVVLSTKEKVETETQQKVVECKQNPSVREI